VSFRTSIEHRRLEFHKPAGTSRGVYQTHDVWYVRLTETDFPERLGIGECAPLPDLSCDAGADYPQRLDAACKELEQKGFIDFEKLKNQPSILFGLETAMRQLRHSKEPTPFYALWDTPFAKGLQGIPINGLVWMGSFRDMEAQIRQKLDLGFTCIKLKIGAIGFEEELELLRQIRREYSANTITLRVDANGAFDPDSALEKLQRLSELDLHSIEQPIRAGQWEAMAALVKASPLPVALDEELIGVHSAEEKKRLLDTINPNYIVLKPTLHGGMFGCDEWINLASDRSIRWWATSALESNIGLNAVAQWCALHDHRTHQGLGTGLLYKNNVEVPLCIRGEKLWFRP
jgi:o-succinylbenzoate synthase